MTTPQPTTDQVASEARDARIEWRKQVIEALSKPHWLPFKLVQLGVESQEPITIYLDFVATWFPGQYTRDVIEMLKSLEEIGLVAISKDRAGQVSYTVSIEDEVTKAFIAELFR